MKYKYSYFYKEFYLKNFKKDFWEILNLLIESQFYSREKLDELINYKLKLLITHVEKNVPFYRNYMKSHGFTSNDINNEQDLKKFFPVITKSIILSNYQDFIPDNISHLKYKKSSTSGSSGKQITFLKSYQSVLWSWAALYRSYTWFGFDIGEKQVSLWGRFDEIKRESLRKKLSSFLNRNIKLSAYQMSDEKIEEYAKFIERYKPKLIRGYASALFALANYLKDNPTINITPPKGISSTADTLTNNMREVIESSFKSEVFNQYACGEIQGGGMECNYHNGLHVAEEHNIYEVEAEEGQEGDIIITDLDNFSMPFIRYKNGDRGIITAEPCECGRNSRRLLKIVGRVNEFVILDDGRKLGTTFFSPFFSKYNFVQQFQIIQEKKDILTVYIVSSGTKSELKKLEKDFNSMLESKIAINFKYVDKIAQLKSGKYNVIINKVASENKK